MKTAHSMVTGPLAVRGMVFSGDVSGGGGGLSGNGGAGNSTPRPVGAGVHAVMVAQWSSYTPLSNGGGGGGGGTVFAGGNGEISDSAGAGSGGYLCGGDWWGRWGKRPRSKLCGWWRRRRRGRTRLIYGSGNGGQGRLRGRRGGGVGDGGNGGFGGGGGSGFFGGHHCVWRERWVRRWRRWCLLWRNCDYTNEGEGMFLEARGR